MATIYEADGTKWNTNDPKHILPNDKIGDATVVASVVYHDDERPLEQTLLLLHPEPPYFQVVIVQTETLLVLNEGARIENIVPAVETYWQWGGDY